jgi:phage gpG-like protein
VYADVQQHGNADIPARPFINFTQRDRDRWAGMVAKHVMEATHGVK